MEQLQLDDFLMYNFLSQVQISPDGKKVAYVATTPDLAKNGYNANLYRIDAESGENACLTNSGRVKGFCWQGADTLLTLERGRYIQQLIQAAQTAADTGTVVDVPDFE